MRSNADWGSGAAALDTGAATGAAAAGEGADGAAAAGAATGGAPTTVELIKKSLYVPASFTPHAGSGEFLIPDVRSYAFLAC